MSACFLKWQATFCISFGLIVVLPQLESLLQLGKRIHTWVLNIVQETTVCNECAC